MALLIPSGPSFKLLDRALACLPIPQDNDGMPVQVDSDKLLPSDQLLDSREMMLGSIPVPLVISGTQDRILFVNRAFLTLLKSPAGFPLGKTLSSFLIPPEKPILPAPSINGKGDLSREEGESLSLLCFNGAQVPIRRFTRNICWHGQEMTMSVMYDMSEQNALLDRFLKIAYYDALTGLPNNDYFVDALSQELNRLTESDGYSFSVLMVDMDRFKQLNEQFSAGVTDKILVETAERMKSILQEFASIFRLGGDKFAAILKGVSSKSYVESLLERLQKLIAIPVWLEGESVFPSACITALLDVPPMSVNQVVSRLSITMDDAKKNGVGCVMFVPDEDDEEHSKRGRKDLLKATAEIREALKDANFVPWFQPIYNTATMRLTGFEALARWEDPNRGLLVPGDFIDDAVDAGLMRDIDNMIISKTLSLMGQMAREHSSVKFTVSVNASNASMKSADFFDFLQKELDKSGFPSERFLLELTETTIVENFEKTRGFLETLRKMNIRIALDDFGTGYSSLQYLSQLPIDSIKIDKSFVDQLLKSHKPTSLVKSIIEMAKELDFNIVAEGIETREQNLWLADFIVNGQGFFFSKPLPAEKVQELLEDAEAFEALFQAQEASEKQN